jgi:hypothetical protein
MFSSLSSWFVLTSWFDLDDEVLVERLDDALPVEFLDDDLLVLLGDGVLGAVEVPWPLGVGGLFLNVSHGVLVPPPLLLVILMLVLMVVDSGIC